MQADDQGVRDAAGAVHAKAHGHQDLREAELVDACPQRREAGSVRQQQGVQQVHRTEAAQAVCSFTGAAQ